MDAAFWMVEAVHVTVSDAGKDDGEVVVVGVDLSGRSVRSCFSLWAWRQARDLAQSASECLMSEGEASSHQPAEVAW